MEDLIESLDPNLSVESYEVVGKDIFLHVRSKKVDAKCTYCNSLSSRIHSKYSRQFKDLPILDKGTKIVFTVRKFFCNNTTCRYKTFAEKLDFISPKAKCTRRLEEYVIKLSQNTSSMSAKNILEKSSIYISKSSICNLIKKKKLP